MSGRTAADYVHQVLFFASPDELLTAAVPAVRTGLAGGDGVILTCRDEYNALLADAVSPAPRILRARAATMYPRAATAVEALRRLVTRQLAGGARRIRIVGEASFGTGPDGWAECGRYEAAADALLSAFPVTATCVYDARVVPASVTGRLTEAHPFVLTPTGRRAPNERYVDPAAFLRRATATGPDPVEQSGLPTEFAPVTDLREVDALRQRLAAVLAARGVDRRIAADVVAAIHEVTVNGLMHGRPPVRLRLWTPPGRLVCTVTDAGEGFDDPLAGYLRPDGDPFGPGAGLWLVRQLCDRVEMAQTPAGFTVKLSTSSIAGA
ncbi:sensor histidine kinase [Planosporangium thailandense]|uniref:Sensor histidine kinase n=1 Tax=Planosporangium thailandense TaxID=765197 RepID=A0ABX0Y3H4_9ACTN|nr:sensor histidine kinase [Planosporangium thailandense]